MATLHPFRALRPERGQRRPHRRRSLRRRQHRRGARAGRRQPAELPARVARRDRAAGRQPIRTPTPSTERAAENFAALRKTRAGRRGRAERLLLPAADGQPRPDRPGRLLFASTSTIATSSRSTSARGATRKTIARGTCSRSARRPVRSFSPIARRPTSIAWRRAATQRRAALRLHRARRRAPHDLARRRRRSRRARRRVRAHSGALHRRRPPSRGERGARAHRDARARRSPAHSLGDGADASTMLAVAFPHDQVQILPYNRTVKDLGGLSPDAFLAAVRERFDVDGRARRRRRARGDIAMYFQGGVAHAAAARRARRRRIAIGSLDVSVLQEQLLAPVLKIADVRTDKRIDFVGGARGTGELETARRLGQGGGRVLAVPGQRRRSDGGVRRRRDHAAQVHVVRAEAAGRVADPCDLSTFEVRGSSVLVRVRVRVRGARRASNVERRMSHESSRRRQIRAERHRRPEGRRLRRRLPARPQGRRADAGAPRDRRPTCSSSAAPRSPRRCSKRARSRSSSAPAPATTRSTSRPRRGAASTCRTAPARTRSRSPSSPSR